MENYIVSLDNVSIAETRGDFPEVANPSKTASEESVVTSKSKTYTWMLLGVTGAGKSCLGNFILGEEDAFPESKEGEIMWAKTVTASCRDGNLSDSGGLLQQFCIIDTPGLGDTKHIGKHDLKEEDISEDAAHLATEITKMMLFMRGGITSFLITIPGHVREHLGTLYLLDCLQIFGKYWNHSILVVTHGSKLGRSKAHQYEQFERLYQGPEDLRVPIWENLVEKVNKRYIIVEGKDWRDDSDYRDGVLRKLLSLSDDITEQHGPYRDDLNSIGNKAFEKAKLEVVMSKKYKDLETPEAQEAISVLAKNYLEEVIIKLARIKLAGGEDVDQLKKMNETKQRELEKLTEKLVNIAEEARQRAVQEKEEERRRREQAEQEKEEERRRRERAEQVMAEERRKREQAEQVQAEERRRREQAEQVQAEERRGREQAEQVQAEERRGREQAEQVQAEERRRRKQAEQEKEDERRRRERAEQVMAEERRKREQAEQVQAEERRRREQAEQEQTIERRARANTECLQADDQRRREHAERVQAEERQRREQAERVQAEERRKREQAEEVQAEEQWRRKEAERVQVEERRKREQAEQVQAEERWRRKEAERLLAQERMKKEQAEQVLKNERLEREWANEERKKAESRTQQTARAWRDRNVLERVLNIEPFHF